MITMEKVKSILTEDEIKLITPIFNSRNGQFRSSKPFNRIGNDEHSLNKGCSNYIWRMIAFDFSAYGKNACMPVCADFDAHAAVRRLIGDKPEDMDKRHAKARDILITLDALIKRVESVVPVIEQAGVMRWGRALGYIQ